MRGQRKVKKMQIIKKNLLSSAHGTHKYYVEWIGEYTDTALINAVDGSTGNYGGYVKVFHNRRSSTYVKPTSPIYPQLVDCERNKYRGIVGVYYE